jgi:hypothetical protein
MTITDDDHHLAPAESVHGGGHPGLGLALLVEQAPAAIGVRRVTGTGLGAIQAR